MLLAVQIEDLDPLVENQPQFARIGFDLQQVRQTQERNSTPARGAAPAAPAHAASSHPAPAAGRPETSAPAGAAPVLVFRRRALHDVGRVVARLGVEFPESGKVGGALGGRGRSHDDSEEEGARHHSGESIRGGSTGGSRDRHRGQSIGGFEHHASY